ncbi:MAG: sulfotransferase [Planctomycetales bacterium]|nr:sulfotransferase [Planctomycetales bacterium]
MSLDSEIVVVSGLPRSGTSLMMQMLDRGGIPALTDHERIADVDNPRGYYEFEAVKRTKDDSAWVCDAKGKVVKMVSSLLYDLPTTEKYRVIFLRRNFDEMLDSQEKMLKRLGKPAAPRDAIKSAYNKHLKKLFEWLPTQPHLRALVVSYNDVIDDAEKQVARIVEFLDGVPSAEKMLQAIDPALYRNRAS